MIPQMLHDIYSSILSSEAISFDVTIMDESGSPLCVFDRLEVARHGFSRAAVNKRYDVVYERTGVVLPVHGSQFLMPAAVSSPPISRRELAQAADGDDSLDNHLSSSGPLQ